MNIPKLQRCFLKTTQRSQLQSCKKSNQNQTSSEYCMDLMRRYDYENFICTMLLKNNPRSVAIGVRGFNIEVALVAEKVSQPSIGLMRLKFWEETLEKCFKNDPKNVPKHPVAIEIYKALQKSKLTKKYFRNLISARQDYTNLNGFKNLEHMEKYCEQSVSNLYYLILEGCGLKNIHADHAASHLGKAQGIVQQIRSIPLARQLNFIAIPQDIMLINKISQEEVLRNTPSKRLEEGVFEIASRAHQHLKKCRHLAESVPKEGRCALLPAVTVDIYLNRLQKVNYNVFDASLKRRPWKMFPKLYFSNLKKEY